MEAGDWLLSGSALLLLLLFLAGAWWSLRPPKRPADVAGRVAVLVVGDLGRSPRMQYHALSLARRGRRVAFIGYAGESSSRAREAAGRGPGGRLSSRSAFSPKLEPGCLVLLQLPAAPARAAVREGCWELWFRSRGRARLGSSPTWRPPPVGEWEPASPWSSDMLGRMGVVVPPLEASAFLLGWVGRSEEEPF